MTTLDNPQIIALQKNIFNDCDSYTWQWMQWSAEVNWRVAISVMDVFHFVVMELDCVFWSSVATLTFPFHVDVTCGPPVVVDVVWKTPTSFHHFNHSDSVNINENERKNESRVCRKLKKLKHTLECGMCLILLDFSKCDKTDVTLLYILSLLINNK